MLSHSAAGSILQCTSLNSASSKGFFCESRALKDAFLYVLVAECTEPFFCFLVGGLPDDLAALTAMDLTTKPSNPESSMVAQSIFCFFELCFAEVGVAVRLWSASLLAGSESAAFLLAMLRGIRR